jgi:hypothetical protein
MQNSDKEISKPPLPVLLAPISYYLLRFFMLDKKKLILERFA